MNQRRVAFGSPLSWPMLIGVSLTFALCSANSEPVNRALDRPALISPKANVAVLEAAAKAGNRLVAVGERGIVLLSDDQGQNWRQVPVPTSATLTAIQFVDSKRGWTVGHSGVVLATSDSGETWKQQLNGISAARLALFGAQASGDEVATAQARRMVADGADKPLLDLHFFDARRGWVIGAYNLAFFTVDGGQTWASASQRLPNPKGLHLYGMRALGEVLLVAGEQGAVFVSTDRGDSFRQVKIPYRGSFFTAELLGERDFIVAGLRGNAWRSRDGGSSWTQLNGAPPISFTASAVLPDGGVLLANQGGMVFTVDGERLKAVVHGQPPLDGLLPLDRNLVLGLSLSGAAPFSIGTQGISK